jgi:hypothetical protein
MSEAFDRWALVVRMLLGLPTPPLPPLPGRVHRCLGGVAAGDTDAELTP